MSESHDEKNRSIVLEAFETLFNKRDYGKALNFWSSKYIQHSAHIPPGRDGLFELINNVPTTMRYENQLTVANGDFVLHQSAFAEVRGLTQRIEFPESADEIAKVIVLGPPRKGERVEAASDLRIGFDCMARITGSRGNDGDSQMTPRQLGLLPRRPIGRRRLG
jgi:hypothetical protein